MLLLIYIFLVFVLSLMLPFCALLRLREPLLALARWAMRLGPPMLGIKVEVSGRQHIKKKSSYVFMANHLSFLDGPLLFMAIPQSIRVILKKEVFRIPVIGIGMKHVGFVPVDRKRARGGKRSIEKAAHFMRERGYSYLIFPEGTRSRDGCIQDFRRGGFFLALESQSQVAPITIKGSYELMPRGTIFTKKGIIKVVFHPPVPAQDFSKSNMQSLIDRVKGVIESGLQD